MVRQAAWKKYVEEEGGKYLPPIDGDSEGDALVIGWQLFTETDTNDTPEFRSVKDAGHAEIGQREVSKIIETSQGVACGEILVNAAAIEANRSDRKLAPRSNLIYLLMLPVPRDSKCRQVWFWSPLLSYP